MLITNIGLKPDPVKVEDTMKMPMTTDVAGAQHLNGFVNYLAKFLPGLADVMEPIRQLTLRGVPWNWSESQIRIFKDIQKLVSESLKLL